MQKINFWTLGNRNAAPQEKLSELGEMFFLQSQHLKIFHSSVSTSLSLPSILYSINFFSKTSFNENKCKCDMKHGVLGQPQCDCLPSAPRMTSKQKFCAGKLYPVFLTPFSFFPPFACCCWFFSKQQHERVLKINQPQNERNGKSYRRRHLTKKTKKT